MRGYFALLISSSALFELATVHPMLDWPEPIQTSPTRTSWTTMVLLPATVSCPEAGPALSGLSQASHLPAESATVWAVWP